VPNKGKNRVEQKLSDMTTEMCIIFCSLFAYRHSLSIITRRRWTSNRRKLYRTTEHRDGVAVVRKEYQNCDKLWKWLCCVTENFRTNRHRSIL